MTDPIITEAQTWFQKHERLIIVIAGLVVFVYLGHAWLTHYYEVATQEVANASKTLATQQQINQQHEQEFTQLQQQVSQLVAQVTSQNAQLQQQNATAIQNALKQQAADQRLTNQQLADRIGQLTNQQNIQSTPQGVDLTHDQSVGITQNLDSIPLLKEQLNNDSQIMSNLNTEISGLQNENNSCSVQVTGLNKQLTDQKTLDEAELKKAKIANFKSKLKWFGVGFVSGFITGHIY